MKKRFGVVLVIFFILVLSISVFAPRVPTVNGDNNAWGEVLNTYLAVAHASDGSIKSGHITSGMISDDTITTDDISNNTIGAGDIALLTINTSHIVEGTILSADIADGTILGADVSTAAALNVSTLNVGLNKTRSPGLAMNISGIYSITNTSDDLGSIAAGGGCHVVNLSMPGLPSGSDCLPVMSLNAFTATNATNTHANLTFVGMNSTYENCRIAVCNIADDVAVDPGLISFRVIAFATGV